MTVTMLLSVSETRTWHCLPACSRFLCRRSKVMRTSRLNGQPASGGQIVGAEMGG